MVNYFDQFKKEVTSENPVLESRNDFPDTIETEPQPETSNYFDQFKKPQNIGNAILRGVGNVATKVLGEGMVTGEFDKMTPLGKGLDIINRPGAAVRGGIGEVISGQKEGRYNPLTGTPLAWMGGEIKSPLSLTPLAWAEESEVIKSAIKGFTGKERVSGNDLWKEAGVSGVPLLGFVTELATDPLMHGGYSAATKFTGEVAQQGTRKALSISKSALDKISAKSPTLGKAIAATHEIIEPVTTQLRKAFINSTGNKDLDLLVKKYSGGRKYLEQAEIKYGLKIRNSLQQIADRLKVKPEEVSKKVRAIIELQDNYPEELAKLVPKIDPSEQLLANVLKSHYKNTLLKEIEAGVPIASLGAGTTVKISKVREQLNNLRLDKRSELLADKDELLTQLDELGKFKTNQLTGKLLSEKEALENTAFNINKNKVGSLTGKVKSIDEQLRTIEKQIMFITEQNMRNGTKIPIGRLKQLAARLENDYWYYTGELAERIQDIPELVSGSKFALKIKDIENTLAKGIEVDLGRTGVSLGKKIIGKEDLLNNVTGLIPGFKLNRQSGKLLKELSNLRGRKELGYFPRFTSDEVNQYLNAARINGAKEWNAKIGNAKTRATGQYTLDEVNEFFKEHGLEKLGGQQIEEYFITNPAMATVRRGISSAKGITSAQFIQEVGENFGKHWSEAPQYWQELPENLQKLYPNLKGLKFDPTVLEEISSTYEKVFNPKSVGAALKIFDTAQNYWKKWTLMPFGKYHIRNVVGNVWNNYLAGVVDPLVYGRAGAIQNYRKTGNDTFLRLMGITKEQADDLILNAKKNGVFGHGQFSEDVGRTVKQEFANKWTPTGIGLRTGSTLENNARLAHFIDKLGKGMSPEDAANSVKKFLFDYGDLTPFEQQVMKRLMPFYTWSRKNVPLQLENVWKQPEKYFPMDYMLRNRNEKNLQRLKIDKPWLYERLPIELKLGSDKNKVIYTSLEGLLPAGDLSKLGGPNQVTESLIELLSPALKVPIEIMMNKSMFFEGDIDKGYPEKLLGRDISPKVKYALVNLNPWGRILREIDKIVTKKRKGEVPLNKNETIFSNTLGSVFKDNIFELRKRAIDKMERSIQELERAKTHMRKSGRFEAYKTIFNKIKDGKETLRSIK